MPESDDIASQFEIVNWDKILEEKKIDFILSKEQIAEMLKILGNDLDEDGFVLSDRARVYANDSDEIRSEEIGAILPGSKVFIKNNIAGFSQYLCDHKGR